MWCRLFKRNHTRSPLPAIVEKKPSAIAKYNMQDLEEFFNMMALANANRFDDQRSPAPKILQPKGPIWRAPSDEINDQGTPSYTCTPKGQLGLKLDHLPPSIAMSMPDLHFGHPAELQMHHKAAQSYDRGPPPQLPPERQSGAGAALESPLSGPLRQHNTQTGGKGSWWSPGASPSRTHQDSSLATTSHVCSRANHQHIASGHGRVDHSDQRNDRILNQLHSPVKTMDRKLEEGGEALVQDRDSPDGKLPSEIPVRDIGLPQRTYPDGAAVRRHQSVKAAPSDPAYSYQTPYYYRGIRVGGTNSLGRRDSQKAQGRRVSTPTLTQVTNRPLSSRRVLSETDRSQSVEAISPTDEARSSHILFDAGLGFLSPQSPIVKGVSVSTRRDSFSGGRPKLGSWSKQQKSIIQEHCEM